MVADASIVTSASRQFAKHLLRVGATAALATLLAACGNKGPLFLPEQAKPAEPAEARQNGADANDVSRRNESLSHTPLTQ